MKFEKETLRAEHHQKKCICSKINIVLKWNFQLSEMNAWIRSQHKQFFFRMKFLIVLPQPKAHPKPLRPESCSPIFPPKKPWTKIVILEPHCLRMFEPCFNDKMLKDSFNFSFLKNGSILMPSTCAKQLQCPPNHPQPIPSPKWERPRNFFPRVLQTSVFHFGVPICFTREKSCI